MFQSCGKHELLEGVRERNHCNAPGTSTEAIDWGAHPTAHILHPTAWKECQAWKGGPEDCHTAPQCQQTCLSQIHNEGTEPSGIRYKSLGASPEQTQKKGTP